MARPSTTQRKAPASSGFGVIQLYLVLYNVASAAAWAYVLLVLGSQLLSSGGDTRKSYGAAGWLVTVVQSFAVLEIFHALFGLVKTPVVTTVIQVSSRLLLVWGVLYPFDVSAVRQHWAVTSMISAWCVAEIVRYLFYTFSLVGSVPSFLVWCRYNFFYVLYPVGAGSEWILLLLSLPFAKSFNPILYYVYIVIACTYPPGLYTMMGHMAAQRRKVMRASKTVKKA